MNKEEEDEEVFNKFCKQVVNLDSKIRFAGIADEDGKLKSMAERPGLNPLLTPRKSTICNYCCYKTIHKIKVGIHVRKDSVCQLQI